MNKYVPSRFITRSPSHFLWVLNARSDTRNDVACWIAVYDSDKTINSISNFANVSCGLIALYIQYVH